MADTPEQDRSPALTLQELRNTAGLLERQVLAAGRLTESALDARRPGGAVQGTDTPSAWLAYALWLAEQAAARADGAEAVTRAGAHALHDALADEPAAVALTGGTLVHVHPKSLNALLVLDGLDADIRQVLSVLHEALALPDDAGAAARAQLQFVGALIKARTIRLWAWILTHPGPGLPFDETAADPKPPEWTAALTGADLQALVLAHLQVNRRDLELLTQAFPAEGGATASRLPLSGLLGAQAAEDGLPPKTLIADRSLRSVFAAGIARAELQRQALQRARAGADE